MHSQVANHLVRRGVQMAGDAMGYSNAQVAQLKADAMVYEEGGPGMEVQPYEILLPIFVTVFFMILLASVNYTLGDVIATLVMVEQPSTTIISETKIAADADPDAPLEKAPLVDEEVIVIKEDPITNSIRKTVKHLRRVGGSKAKWRGLGANIGYSILFGISNHFFTMLLALVNPMLAPLSYIISTVILARIHMTITHIIITPSSNQPWWRRVPRGRKYFKTLALPAFVFAAAQQLVIIIPAAVFILPDYFKPLRMNASTESAAAIRIVAAIIAGAATALLILLPATVTLTRIEASLLSEDQETIVSFDRTLNGAAQQAISLDGDRRASKSLFIEAWRSFDKASRIRLIKFYVKCFFIQAFIAVVGCISTLLAFVALGPQRIINLVKAGSAQLQLAAMGEEF